MMGWGGGESPSDFFGSEILAQSYFFESVKDARIFWGRKKNQREFLGCEKRTKGFFWVRYKRSDFFGYKT